MVEATPVFAVLAWANGRGHRLAVVKCDRQRPAIASGLVNRTVMLDGKLWFCTAVDRDRNTGPIVAGEKIYLWVRPGSPA
jgi:hypothetical protein